MARWTTDESSNDEPFFFTVASLTTLSTVCPANKTLTKAETSPCNEASRTTQTHTHGGHSYRFMKINLVLRP